MDQHFASELILSEVEGWAGVAGPHLPLLCNGPLLSRKRERGLHRAISWNSKAWLLWPLSLWERRGPRAERVGGEGC